MGMSGPAMGGGGGRGRRRSRRFAPMSDINVTPFVDVMLVLLIIFMVSAPLLTAGVPIDLPQTAAKPLEGLTDPISISVEPDGKIYVNEAEIPMDQLVTRLQAIAGAGYDERVLVRGDTTANYGVVMQVMGRLNQAGFKKIGLVTSSENS
jgi:biopolymer transport protein TolR